MKRENNSTRTKECLTPNCENLGTRRGLCSSCRLAAKRAISAGETTEEDLVKLGLMNAKFRRGKFSLALADRTKESEAKSNDQGRKKGRTATNS
jgi:hypothetical protein